MTLQRRKELSVIAFTSLYSVLFFLTFALVLREGRSGTVWAIALAIGTWMWISLTAASFGFLHDRIGARSTLVLMYIPVIWIAGAFSMESLVGGIIATGILAMARMRVTDEIQSRVQLKNKDVFAISTKYIIIACAITLIALVLPLIRARISSGSLTIPEQFVNGVLKPAAPLIGRILPGYTEFTTVDQLINNQAQQNLPPGVVLPPGEQVSIKQDLSKRLGIAIAGSETVPEVSAALMNRYLQNLSNQGGLAVILIMIAVAYLTIRALLPFLIWPALGGVAMWMYIAERIGLITKIKTQALVERLHI